MDKLTPSERRQCIEAEFTANELDQSARAGVAVRLQRFPTPEEWHGMFRDGWMGATRAVIEGRPTTIMEAECKAIRSEAARIIAAREQGERAPDRLREAAQKVIDATGVRLVLSPDCSGEERARTVADVRALRSLLSAPAAPQGEAPAATRPCADCGSEYAMIRDGAYRTVHRHGCKSAPTAASCAPAGEVADLEALNYIRKAWVFLTRDAPDGEITRTVLQRLDRMIAVRASLAPVTDSTEKGDGK